jgi:crotonobetainyl-CoA:carnitine CoA-transferase CaiB-like acyl-CoA transferase
MMLSWRTVNPNPNCRRSLWAFQRIVANVLYFWMSRREMLLKDIQCDEATVRRVNPKAILMQFDAFGGASEKGPRADYIGYDDIVQASTGIMSRFGGSFNTPEEHAHLGTIDVVSGFLGACAVSLALFHRQRTGRCLVARTSLACAGMALQTPFMWDYVGRESFNKPSGRFAMGEHAFKLHTNALASRSH